MAPSMLQTKQMTADKASQGKLGSRKNTMRPENIITDQCNTVYKSDTTELHTPPVLIKAPRSSKKSSSKKSKSIAYLSRDGRVWVPPKDQFTNSKQLSSAVVKELERQQRLRESLSTRQAPSTTKTPSLESSAMTYSPGRIVTDKDFPDTLSCTSPSGPHTVPSLALSYHRWSIEDTQDNHNEPYSPSCSSSTSSLSQETRYYAPILKGKWSDIWKFDPSETKTRTCSPAQRRSISHPPTPILAPISKTLQSPRFFSPHFHEDADPWED